MESNKRALRKEILALRNRMSDVERSEQSKQNTIVLLSDNRYMEAKQLLLFASYGSEADTFPLFRQAIADGKEVYFPKVVSDGESDEMIFYRVWRESDLVPGFKGIPEPKGDSTVFRYDENKGCLMILPGAAFDKEHNRIGYGRGFYDRYLSKYPELQKQTIAIGFACQLVDEIDADEYDCKPAGILLSGRWIGA